MTTQNISLRRRHLMIAGAAGLAAPACEWMFPAAAMAANDTGNNATGEELIVSHRRRQ